MKEFGDGFGCVIFAACVLRAPHRSSPPGFRHLSIRVRSYHDQLHGPIRFPQHLFSVHDHGRQRSGRGAQHLSCPYVGLTVHWAVSVRRTTTGRWPSRSGAVFVDDPHPRSNAGRPLEPWVCRHTREPTVLSRVSCRPSHLNVDRFHQPCLLPWRAPLLPPKHGWLGQWYHVAATYPFSAARLSPFATHWRYCHADWTVPRQDVNSSFLSCVCHPDVKGAHTHAGWGPSRFRRRLLSACLGDPIPLATLIDIVTETTIVSFSALPVGFPLPTISKNSLSTLFCPLILDHGVPFRISISGLKILSS